LQKSTSNWEGFKVHTEENDCKVITRSRPLKWEEKVGVGSGREEKAAIQEGMRERQSRELLFQESQTHMPHISSRLNAPPPNPNADSINATADTLLLCAHSPGPEY